MGAMTPIQFASQSYLARSSNVSCQRLINLFLEANPSGAKGPTTLYGTPGLKLWSTVGAGPVRGMHVCAGVLYVVSGDKLYAIPSGALKVATEVGPVLGTGPVIITSNATHIGIVTSAKLYAANQASIIELPETNMNGATYQDGYGIFSQQGTQKFFVTGIDDMTTIGALDYSTADASTGLLMGCIADHGELMLFKTDGVEFWRNVGDPTFPFSRIAGAYIEIGCASSYSIAKADNRVFYLGADYGVYSVQGYQPQLISTPVIELMIRASPAKDTARAFVYRQQGHTFYVLSLSDLTLCYDLSTGLWHERKSDLIDRWRASCGCDAFGLSLVGDYDNGKIYDLDLDTYLDDGATITRQAVTPPIAQDGYRVSMAEVFLDMETGVGLNLGQGSDPLVLLDWSDDGGHQWTPYRDGWAGKIGEYRRQVRWTRLGDFRQRVLRVTITDPVKIAIISAAARLELRQ